MTAPLRNHWYKIPRLNLAVAARKAGFDLSIFEYYSSSVQRELKKHSISEMMIEIRNRVAEENGFELKSFDKSVYVISLSHPLTILYPVKRSHVIYIGQGRAGARIESHFKSKLFDFMQSIAGAEYDIQISLPKRAGTKNYFKHVEFLMLSHFAEKYGGSERTLPLLNKNRGSNHGYVTNDNWWQTAVDRVGKTPIWSLKPIDMPATWKLD